MFFLYLDESGSNTTHFVLLGLAIPALSWRDKSAQVAKIKDTYQLSGQEIHTAWMRRQYIEQNKTTDFESLNHEDRRSAVESKQRSALHWLSTTANRKKNYIEKNRDKKNS